MLQGLSWLLDLQFCLLTELFSPQQTHYHPYHFGCHPNRLANLRITLTHEQDPRYLNSAAWRYVSLPTQNGLPWLSSIALDLEVLILIPAASDLSVNCSSVGAKKSLIFLQQWQDPQAMNCSSYASAPTNPAYKNEKQSWWQRSALIEAKSHHKRVHLTASTQKPHEEIEKLAYFPRVWMKTPLDGGASWFPSPHDLPADMRVF